MMRIVKKYLIPNPDNEYKPHLLRKAGIAVIASIAVAIFAIGTFQSFVLQNTSYLSAVLPQVLVDLTNRNRANNQVALLTMNPVLQNIAQAKVNDMASKSYFAHTNPEGKQFWAWFRENGYNYLYAGENLAVNFSDSEEVDQAWMNSPGHRANLLNGKFTEVGIATANGVYNGRPTIFIAQEFGRQMPGVTTQKVAPKTSITTQKTTVPASTSPVLAATSTSSTTRVLGETNTKNIEQPKVLAETDTFIAVENTSPADIDSVTTEVQDVQTGSKVVALSTQPKKLSSLYLVLAGLVILALACMIGIEFRRQHPKNVLAGTVLLIFIVVLFYIYQNVLFGQVIIL